MQDIDQLIVCGVGTGTMGSGTALAFALAGRRVRLYGRSEQGLTEGRGRMARTVEACVGHGLLSAGEAEAALGRVTDITELAAAVGDADFIIESITEDLPVKREMFARIEALCPAGAILASNTSGLSPTAMAEPLRRRERFVVTHFWNPAPLMPLVEVVPGEHTAPETVEATRLLLERIGKKPVVLRREAPGFIGNRIQFAVLREALAMVESGIADMAAVDDAVKYGLGRRYGTTGPLESADLGGLDVFRSIAQYLLPDLCADPGVPPLLARAVEDGHLGTKTGTGLYAWTPEALGRVQAAREKALIDWLKKDREGLGPTS